MTFPAPSDRSPAHVPVPVEVGARFVSNDRPWEIKEVFDSAFGRMLRLEKVASGGAVIVRVRVNGDGSLAGVQMLRSRSWYEVAAPGVVPPSQWPTQPHQIHPQAGC